MGEVNVTTTGTGGYVLFGQNVSQNIDNLSAQDSDNAVLLKIAT